MEGIKSHFKRLLNKRRIVGFIGVIGSGKDHKADKYVFENGFTRISFADPLRLLLSTILGKDIVYDNYNKFKNTNIIVGFFWRMFSGRDFIQRLGDGIRLVFGEDLFLNIMDKKIESLSHEHPGVVVPDVRYLNEAMYVLEVGGQLIFSNYESDRYDFTSPHVSEQLAQTFIALGFNDYDKITLDDLKTAAAIIEESGEAWHTVENMNL